MPCRLACRFVLHESHAKRSTITITDPKRTAKWAIPAEWLEEHPVSISRSKLGSACHFGWLSFQPFDQYIVQSCEFSLHEVKVSEGWWARDMGPPPRCSQSMNSASNLERHFQFQDHCSNPHLCCSHLPHSHLLKILHRLHPHPLQTDVARHFESVIAFSGQPFCSTLFFFKWIAVEIALPKFGSTHKMRFGPDDR